MPCTDWGNRAKAENAKREIEPSRWVHLGTMSNRLVQNSCCNDKSIVEISNQTRLISCISWAVLKTRAIWNWSTNWYCVFFVGCLMFPRKSRICKVGIMPCARHTASLQRPTWNLIMALTLQRNCLRAMPHVRNTQNIPKQDINQQVGSFRQFDAKRDRYRKDVPSTHRARHGLETRHRSFT